MGTRQCDIRTTRFLLGDWGENIGELSLFVSSFTVWIALAIYLRIEAQK
jgi:hypothetical protein